MSQWWLMGATRGLPYIYLIQKITQNYLWQRGKGLNQIVCNFDSTFDVRLWQNQLENSVTKRSRIRHQLDCPNKNSQTHWCDTTCIRKRHFLSHENFNGIYKISRDRSVRETSHKVNVNESTYANEWDKETLNTIRVNMWTCEYENVCIQWMIK